MFDLNREEPSAGEKNLSAEEKLWRKWRWLYWGGPLVLGIGAIVLVEQIRSYRVEHNPRVVGTILEVWRTERTRSTFLRRSSPPQLLGRIAFTREYRGKKFECEVVAVIGQPDESLKVGDKIDVTPQEGSCYTPLIPRMIE